MILNYLNNLMFFSNTTFVNTIYYICKLDISTYIINFKLIIDKLTEFDFINERPITNFYKNMKEINIPILAKYLESIVDRHSENCSYSSTDLFSNFNDFLKSNNFKVEYTST